MPSRRLIILLLLLAAAAAALFAAAPGARRQRPATAAPPAPAVATQVAVNAGGDWDAGRALDGPARLQAVQTVELFCRLLGDRLYWPAAGMFAAQRVWTRADLRSVRALTFRSARVLTAPDPATVTVAAVVNAVVRPESPVPPGDATLFFTLGRVGTTTGGWLIQAITARPQPHRKGSQ
jgi:hypothetical protein